MNKYKISLKAYLNLTQKYYYFFDGFIKMNKLKKIDVLNENGISFSSYKYSRGIDIASNNNHLLLLKYFKISRINDNYVEYAEKILTDIYFSIYYKRDYLYDSHMNTINKLINDNNYLKPIFVVFKVLLVMNSDKAYDTICELIDEDMKYLSFIPINYFYNELKYYYELILLYVKKINNITFDFTAEAKNHNILWMYYHIKGTFYYTNNDYAKSLVYFQHLCEIYKKDYNLIRSIICKNNILQIYNLLGLYDFTIDEAIPIIDYLIYQTDKKQFTMYSIRHLFAAYVCSEKYNDLIIYYNKFINDNSLIAGTASICLLIAYKKCNYKKEYIEANLKDIICANEKNKLAYNKLFNNYTITKSEYEMYFSNVIYSFLYDQFLL